MKIFRKFSGIEGGAPAPGPPTMPTRKGVPPNQNPGYATVNPKVSENSHLHWFLDKKLKVLAGYFLSGLKFGYDFQKSWLLLEFLLELAYKLQTSLVNLRHFRLQILTDFSNTFLKISPDSDLDLQIRFSKITIKNN